MQPFLYQMLFFSKWEHRFLFFSIVSAAYSSASFGFVPVGIFPNFVPVQGVVGRDKFNTYARLVGC